MTEIEMMFEGLMEIRQETGEWLAETLGIDSGELNRLSTDGMVQLALATAAVGAEAYAEGMLVGGRSLADLTEFMPLDALVAEFGDEQAAAADEGLAEADAIALDAVMGQVQVLSEQVAGLEGALAKNGIFVNAE